MSVKSFIARMLFGSKPEQIQYHESPYFEENPSDNFSDVGLFHKKFGLPYYGDCSTKPQLLDAETFKFRDGFISEEHKEFKAAHRAGDLNKAADALIDMVYVIKGTAHMMGLPWQEMWDRVQRANMAKERSSGSDDPRSTRKNSLDVVKPVGWKAPDFTDILEAHGYVEPPKASSKRVTRKKPS